MQSPSALLIEPISQDRLHPVPTSSSAHVAIRRYSAAVGVWAVMDQIVVSEHDFSLPAHLHHSQSRSYRCATSDLLLNSAPVISSPIS